jgi:dipeptidyl aminopeptidase/acylaminoacyl peptidase
MQKRITRRGFLTRAAVGGAGLMVGSTGFSMNTVSADAATRTTGSPAAYRPTPAEYAALLTRQEPYEEIVRLPVYKTQIAPHWFANNTRFWYRNDLAKARQEFVLVDAANAVRKAAFDHNKIAASLSKVRGKAYEAGRLPFREIAFTDDGKSVLFAVDQTIWQCDLTSYVTSQSTRTELTPGAAKNDARPEGGGGGAPENASPDGRWIAFVKDNNLWLRDAKSGAEKALGAQGTAEHPISEMLRWSPDSRTIVAFTVAHVPVKPVYMVESSPKNGDMRGELHHHEYEQPGDELSKFDMWIFGPEAGTVTKAQIDTIDFWDGTDIRWREGSSDKFYFERTDRGHQRFRLFEIDARTGAAKTVVDERAQTFINSNNGYTYYPKDSTEAIYASEIDGWRHLYLYDTNAGALKNPITRGDWVVRSVDRVDDDARQIWFAASGKNHGEDPYLIHHYRVNFDGSNLVPLTEGNGTHEVQYSPDRKYLIDSYSRVDLPPMHTLRRVADGSPVVALEQADASELIAAGWRMPEPFVAKGRDGQTDIWGIIVRPFLFDPAKKYPVVENIYAGPQDSFVQKSFSGRNGMQSLANQGFIVVMSDGMGTRNRSKAFHDVCWRNIKDAGFPDRIAWIKAVAAKYPYCDTERVGIYGTSAGGQNSTGALLFHPEFYKVGVSSCGCHDNRIDKRWWNEQWMGYPVGSWYKESSNIENAGKLRGKLLLMVGELDSNVPPESTLRLTDALMLEDKDFDLLVLTGMDHTGGGSYGERRRVDYFVRHLLGVEPPDRNAPKKAPTPVTLHPRPVNDEAMAQTDGGPDTSVEFRNDTGKTVELFWLQGGGKRTSYGEILPGASRVLHTYAGHSWLVVTTGGAPIAVFVGERRPGIAEIRGGR